jgi:hypothetical protein
MATRARRPLLHYSKVATLPRSAPTSPPLRLIGALGLLFVLTGLALLARELIVPPAAAPAAGPVEYVVYAEFGLTADSVYRANAARPSERTRLHVIPHAREFGIVAATSPDGGAFAYTALPAGTLAPAPDTPAELWLAPLEDGAPRKLAGGFDLRVRPVWSPDGGTIIARRSASDDAAYDLVGVDARTGAEVVLARSASAPFPAGFSPAGDALYYATIDSAGSELHRVDLAGLASSQVARLSDGLTRDWALSPDSSRLAYLSLLPQGAGRFASRVQVLDLASGAIAPSVDGGDEFGPSWTPAGALTLGRLESGKGALVVDGVSSAPADGFDVPLAWSRSGSNLAIRVFDGVSLTAPGTASLVTLGADGKRHTIANGEVTFIGWTYR